MSEEERAVERGQRLAEERKRLGYTPIQLATLVGLDVQDYQDIEDGKWEPAIQYNYRLYMPRANVDVEYVIRGVRDIPEGYRPMQHSASDWSGGFSRGLDLLRKSVQAVEAFVGKNAARECPELVSALMMATLKDSDIGTGQLEDAVNGLSGAIESAAQTIAEVLKAPEP